MRRTLVLLVLLVPAAAVLSSAGCSSDSFGTEVTADAEAGAEGDAPVEAGACQAPANGPTIIAGQSGLPFDLSAPQAPVGGEYELTSAIVEAPTGTTLGTVRIAGALRVTDGTTLAIERSLELTQFFNAPPKYKLVDDLSATYDQTTTRMVLQSTCGAMEAGLGDGGVQQWRVQFGKLPDAGAGIVLRVRMEGLTVVDDNGVSRTVVLYYKKR